MCFVLWRLLKVQLKIEYNFIIYQADVEAEANICPFFKKFWKHTNLQNHKFNDFSSSKMLPIETIKSFEILY